MKLKLETPIPSQNLIAALECFISNPNNGTLNAVVKIAAAAPDDMGCRHLGCKDCVFSMVSGNGLCELGPLGSMNISTAHLAAVEYLAIVKGAKDA